MIEIQKRAAIFSRKSGNAVFVKLGHNVELIGLIQKLNKIYYHPYTKEFEIPLTEYKTFVKLFEGRDLTTTAVDKGTMELLKRADEFNVIASNFNTPSKDLDFKFKTKPFKHQQEAFDFAREHQNFLLADDQGLGKTKQAIDIAVSRKSQMKHTLIVCGVNGLKWNWKNEIATHSNEGAHIIGSRVNRNGKLVQDGTQKKLEDLKTDHDEFFLITNVETLRNKEIQSVLHEMTTSGEIGMVVIDEIHKCKSPSSQIGKAIHKLDSYYKIGLTGTPLLNSPIDLYNLLKWLGEHTDPLYAFQHRYCIYGGFGGYEVVGYKNTDELRDRLVSYQLRRLKHEVLDLPPKIHTTEFVEMGKQQAKLYDDIKEELISQIDEIMLSPNPLAKLTRLRQVTAHPAILDPSIKQSAKIERLHELVTELVASGHKVIIFSNWTSVTSAAQLALIHFNPLIITGAVKVENRIPAIDLFQQDPTRNVIIGTIGAMGTGITLNKASYVIFLDSPWTYGDKVQAEDRAHRIGTENTVNVVTLVAKGTIDEKIEVIVQNKKDLAGFLVDGDVESKQNMIRNLLLML